MCWTRWSVKTKETRQRVFAEPKQAPAGHSARAESPRRTRDSVCGPSLRGRQFAKHDGEIVGIPALGSHDLSHADLDQHAGVLARPQLLAPAWHCQRHHDDWVMDNPVGGWPSEKRGRTWIGAGMGDAVSANWRAISPKCERADSVFSDQWAALRRTQL
jgi:hypothetical protein